MAQELAAPLSRGQPPEQSITETTTYPWDEGDLRFAPLNSTAHSFSSSSESNLSLSVGYFPCEDNFSYENIISCEDTFSEGPSIHFDDPEQFCKLRIALAWDVDMASKNSDSMANWDLSMAQVSHQEHESCQHLAKFNPSENEDVIQFPQIPPRLQKEELAEILSQVTGSQRTSIAETSSISSGPQEKEDTHSSTQALSCLNFGWIFRWLRHQVLPSFWGREHPEKATESPRQLAQKKRLSHRSKRIQPQESLELGHPITPDF
ncbi:hypothetical protein EI555_021582 [Monodon monoceros]|uniref:Uncharacterized protein n=1 Tax=Monodon monoceros TaxID=40151 RepID=A0A4V5P828_MONMO|nr:hypothetical protein EI555_021582 [Monodon monoceros]